MQSHIIYERQKMFNPVPRPRTWPGDEDPNVVGGAGSQSSKQSAAMQLTGRLHHCWVVFVLLSSLNLVLGSSSAKLSPSMVFYHDVKPGPSLSQSGYNVSFDDRSFIIGGKRTLLLSGSVHYPRVMVGEWANIFKEMHADGLNTVQTYIYWNIHEVKRGQEYDFSGNKNWTLFVEKAAEAGLFVTLRIGPFVASEWDYGESLCQY